MELVAFRSRRPVSLSVRCASSKFETFLLRVSTVSAPLSQCRVLIPRLHLSDLFVLISPPGALIYANRVDGTGCLGRWFFIPLNDNK
jgi:hypothetical protein